MKARSLEFFLLNFSVKVNLSAGQLDHEHEPQLAVLCCWEPYGNNLSFIGGMFLYDGVLIVLLLAFEGLLTGLLPRQQTDVAPWCLAAQRNWTELSSTKCTVVCMTFTKYTFQILFDSCALFSKSWKKPNSVHFSSRHSQTALPFWVQKFSTCKHHEFTETNPYHAPCIIVRYQPVPHNKPEISQFLSTPACCDPKDSAQLSSEFRGNHAPTSVIQEIQLESHFFLCLQQLKYHILTNCFYVPECRNNRKYSHKCSFLYLC